MLVFTGYLFYCSQFARDDLPSIYALFSFGIVTIAFEIYKMALTYTIYFKLYWNYFDVLIGILTVIYAYIKQDIIYSYDNMMDYPKYADWVLAVLSFILWIRLISYLRIFSQTRSLIRLIVQIFNDMKAFASVMILAICGFSISFDILSYRDVKEDDTIITSFTHIYRIGFADFKTTDYDIARYVLWLMCSIFLSLIMINMLIAIMSDTYEKIVNAQETSDGQELLDIIYGVENLMFWKRKMGEKNHLHWAYEVKNGG